MWQDDLDNRLMDILENAKMINTELFPVVCPYCGERGGHFYLHRWKKEDPRGSMWVWCSACRQSAHSRYRLPQWWKNPEKIDPQKLTYYPNYLEENKSYIDEWVNEILFAPYGSIK